MKKIHENKNDKCNNKNKKYSRIETAFPFNHKLFSINDKMNVKHIMNQIMESKKKGIPYSPPFDESPIVQLQKDTKCIRKHLTSLTLNPFEEKELLQKCFICKNCSLLNTSLKIWNNIIKNMIGSNKEELIYIISVVYILKTIFYI